MLVEGYSLRPPSPTFKGLSRFVANSSEVELIGLAVVLVFGRKIERPSLAVIADPDLDFW